MADGGAPASGRRMPTYRTHLALTASLATAVFSAVIAVAIFFPIAMQLGRTELDSTSAFGLAEHFLYLHSALWPVIVLSLVASVASANLLFVRMREPLVRFVRAYHMIGRGQMPAPLAIRRVDYLADEAEALNAMIAALHERRRVESDAIARLGELVTDLAEQGVAEPVLAEMQDVMKSLSPGEQRGSSNASPR